MRQHHRRSLLSRWLPCAGKLPQQPCLPLLNTRRWPRASAWIDILFCHAQRKSSKKCHSTWCISFPVTSNVNDSHTYSDTCKCSTPPNRCSRWRSLSRMEDALPLHSFQSLCKGFKAQASTDLVVTCHLPTCTLKRKCHTPTYKTISFACPCTCTFLTCSKLHAYSNSSGAANSDLPGIAEDAEAPERPSRRLRLRARRSRRALAEQYCERSAALRASGEIRVGLHPFLLCAMAVCSLLSSFVRLQQDQGMACLFPLL